MDDRKKELQGELELAAWSRNPAGVKSALDRAREEGVALDLNPLGRDGDTLLCEVAALGCLVAIFQEKSEKVAALLLEAGADPNRVFRKAGATLLHLACRHGREGLARALIAAGARVDEADEEGRAPAHEILSVNREFDGAGLVRALSEAGADFLAPDKRGEAPLDLARARGLEDVARAMEACVESRQISGVLPPRSKRPRSGL